MLEEAKKKVAALMLELEPGLTPDAHRALQAWTWMHMEERRGVHFVKEAQKHELAKKKAAEAK